MKREQWALPVRAEEASKRSAGRQRINEARAKAVAVRRAKLIYLVARDGVSAGAVAAFAAELGVSVRTIQRDLRALIAAGDVVLIEATVRRLIARARGRQQEPQNRAGLRPIGDPPRALIYDSAQEEMARFRQLLAEINAGVRLDGAG